MGHLTNVKGISNDAINLRRFSLQKLLTMKWRWNLLKYIFHLLQPLGMLDSKKFRVSNLSGKLILLFFGHKNIQVKSSDFPISIDLSTISIGSGIYRYRYHIGRHVTIGISIAIELVQISKLLYFENLAISAVIWSNFSKILPFGQYLYL